MLIGWHQGRHRSLQIGVISPDTRHIAALAKGCAIYTPWQAGIAIGAGGFVHPIFHAPESSPGKLVMQ